jgi:hypothetical protein
LNNKNIGGKKRWNRMMRKSHFLFPIFRGYFAPTTGGNHKLLAKPIAATEQGPNDSWKPSSHFTIHRSTHHLP